MFHKSHSGVAQWIERWPANQGVAGLIPGPRAHAWVAGQAPNGGARENYNHTLIFLSLSLPPFPSLK